MGAVDFEATVESDNGGAFVQVPAPVVERLGGGKRPPVRAAIGGHLYRSRLMVYGGRFYLGFRRGFVEESGISPGAQIRIQLEHDLEERDVEVPAQLAEALAGDSNAHSAYQRLSYTHRKEFVEWISSAKKEETKRRRLEKALETLRARG